MLDSTDPLRNLCLFSEGCSSASGDFEPHVSKAETKFIKGSCDNPLCINTPTCKHPELHHFIDEVNGLDFDTQLSNVPYSLPAYIPTLDYYSRNLKDLSSRQYPVVSITLDDILRSGVKMVAGSLHEKEIKFRLTTLLSPAFRGKGKILFLTGSDTLIEWVWYARDDINFFQVIKMMGFDAVVGFNFSVIDGECPVAHAIAQKKSMHSNFLAEQAGLQSIPHMYATNVHHVSRYVSWLQKNPHIKYVAVNAQLQDRPEDVETLVKTIKMVMEQVPHIHVLLQGFHIKRLNEFNQLVSRIHLVEKSPIKDAQFGRKVEVMPEEVDLVRTWKRSGETNKEVMKHNLSHRRAYYELLKQKQATNYCIPREFLEELEISHQLMERVCCP